MTGLHAVLFRDKPSHEGYIELAQQDRLVWTRRRTIMGAIVSTYRVQYKSKEHAMKAYADDLRTFLGAAYRRTRRRFGEIVSAVPPSSFTRCKSSERNNVDIVETAKVNTMEWETTATALQRDDIKAVYENLCDVLSNRVDLFREVTVDFADSGDGTLVRLYSPTRAEPVQFGFANKSFVPTYGWRGFFDDRGRARGSYEVRQDMTDVAVRVMLHYIYQRFDVRLTQHYGDENEVSDRGWLRPRNAEMYPSYSAWVKRFPELGDPRSAAPVRFIYTPVGEPSIFCW